VLQYKYFTAAWEATYEEEVPILGLVIPDDDVTEQMLASFSCRSDLYPQLPAFLRARVTHYLQHRERISREDIPIDLGKIFGGFDLAFRPATYWGTSAKYVDRNDLGDEVTEQDEVIIAWVAIKYDDVSGSSISITAYRPTDHYEIAEEGMEYELDDAEQEQELICYRSVSRDDNGYWSDMIDHRSDEPLAFWELLELLDASDVDSYVRTPEVADLGAELSMSSSVYPELEEFFNVRSSTEEQYGRWIPLQEIFTAVGAGVGEAH
jgi:hypothetical protein